MKILVIDDDPAILRFIAAALEKVGHQITTCDGGGAALQAALSKKFDLALCDLNLPDIHGLEVVRAIKMHSPDLPVIVISAMDPGEWRLQAVAAGADHFLHKPLRLEVLRHEVHMAGLSRTSLKVVLQDDDRAHRRQLEQVLSQGGCEVKVVDKPTQVATTGERPNLVIVDGGSPGSEAVVRWCKQEDVHCFVLVSEAQVADDRLLRQGASLIVRKPANPEAVLVQAKFLAGR